MAEDKRYIPLNQYRERYGGSYHTLKRACETGELPCITTAKGHFLIDTQPQGASVQPLVDEVGQLRKQIAALCSHLGVRV